MTVMMKQPKNAKLAFRAPALLTEEASSCAQDLGINISEFLREALSRHLAAERAQNRPTCGAEMARL